MSDEQDIQAEQQSDVPTEEASTESGFPEPPLEPEPKPEAKDAENADDASDELEVQDEDNEDEDDEDEEAEVKELTFEEKVDRVRLALQHNPRFREIHFRTLEFCLEQQVLHDIEEMIAGLPEFKNCDQNQYRLITYLENAGGLERLELDEDMNIVTEEMKEGLDENEIDDLVAVYAFVTTEAGRAVYEEMRPEKRMDNLRDAFPKRRGAYQKLLAFCKEPRTFKEIDNLLAGSDVLKSGSLNTATDIPLQPSVFIDQLERCGGLVWDDGWHITEGGKKFLELLEKAKG